MPLAFRKGTVSCHASARTSSTAPDRASTAGRSDGIAGRRWADAARSPSEAACPEARAVVEFLATAVHLRARLLNLLVEPSGLCPLARELGERVRPVASSEFRLPLPG